MIRWIWSRIMKWGWDFNHNLRETELSSRGLNKTQQRTSEDVDGEQGLNITIRNAGGGKIVTFRKYDQKTDRSSHKLYVIPDDHDFQKELGQLITMESLR